MDFGIPSFMDPSSESRTSREVVTFLGLAFSLLVLYSGQRCLFGTRGTKLPLPPGPSLLPSSIPDRDIWRTFQQWHARYGPIISLKVGALTVIILGDRQTAHALLDKRGSIYSDRPKSIFVDKYFDRGFFPVLAPANDYWRLHRRLHTALLTTKASETYRDIQELESKQLLFEMLSSHDYKRTFHRFAASAMFTLVYGKGLSTDDLGMNEIRDMDEMVELGVQAISIGSFLVDAFPILDRLPRFFSGWKIAAERAHCNTKSAFTRCINIGFYEDGWNWSQEVSQRKEAQRLTPDQLAYNQGELYVAGSHSARMVMDVFVLTSILQPAAVKKVQQELDRVIGSERLPLFEDMESLPYMNAFILEILRWRQTTPLAVPHAAAKDDEYMGYGIPAGSIVIPNQWQMNMDTEIFDDPDSFNPDRWIENPELPLSVFGFGRRACPGQQIAHSTLFIAISRLLWAFNITSPDKDLKKQLADHSGRLGAVYVPSKINTSFEI
ncbi:hypothetical protein N7509_013353 [Penicillium cosmopolitanum]|uniref:Cytochrome P450 n=1 Tax=Penicillium cosmopolitanum TaxID=1131564 RepID=A0A9W9VC21_9EURO|nr:uncharacterized protein N7509_013353 [Penicillium cosmopolitanum]KAJ5376467.1 hypothetical protein N7509_013353 [Penicillium cosmopolitanum]